MNNQWQIMIDQLHKIQDEIEETKKNRQDFKEIYRKRKQRLRYYPRQGEEPKQPTVADYDLEDDEYE